MPNASLLAPGGNLLRGNTRPPVLQGTPTGPGFNAAFLVVWPLTNTTRGDGDTLGYKRIQKHHGG